MLNNSKMQSRSNKYALIYFQLRKRRRVFKPSISAPLKRNRRRRTAFGSGSDRYQNLARLQNSPFFVDLKRRILNSISYDESKTLVVWCPQNVVPNDYIVTLLHQYGAVNNFIHNFTRVKPNSECSMWYGSIVEYSCVEEALQAFKDAPLKCW